MFRLVLTGLLPVFLAASSGTQNSVLTEAEYLSVLNEAHPAVREAAEAVALAEARVLETTTLENPVLGAVREGSSGSDQQTDVVVSWQLPKVARRSRIEARERKVDAAKAHFGQQLVTHRLVMRELYANWAGASDRQHRLSAQAERVEALAKRQAFRSESGEASGLEAHRLRLAATALRARAALAAADRERARARAAVWHPALPAGALPVLPELPEAPSVDGSSVQVRAAEADLLAARFARQAASRFVASPEVSLGWQREEAGLTSSEGTIVGLAWSIPLFNRNQADRNAADAGIDAAMARLERVEQEVRVSREAARNSFTQLSESLIRTRQELAINQRMLDGAEAAFRHGEASLTDLLETHRAVTEAELALLDRHQATLAAHRELERLAGSLAPGPDVGSPHTTKLSTDLQALERTP